MRFHEYCKRLRDVEIVSAAVSGIDVEYRFLESFACLNVVITHHNGRQVTFERQVLRRKGGPVPSYN